MDNTNNGKANTINTNNNNTPNREKIKPEVSKINNLWTTVKELTNTSTKTPPRHIIHENSIITSIRKIANIANQHFINKIKTIRSKFTPSNTTHIQILEQLINKPNSKFTIPYITV